MKEYLVNFVDFRRRSLQKLKRAWFFSLARKFSLAGEGVAATQSMTREWKQAGKQKVERKKQKKQRGKSRAVVLSTPSEKAFAFSRPSSTRDNYIDLLYITKQL